MSVSVTQQTTRAPLALAKPCKDPSWSPEVHDFYGDPATIIRHMDGVAMNLQERRIFLLLTERDGQAEVRFYEQVDGRNYAVSTWHGESLGDLNARIAATMLRNKGIYCIGEQVRELLSSLGLKLAATVPAPANARAAFAHPIRAHGEGTFTRATTALLC